jgi:hypothetical protein
LTRAPRAPLYGAPLPRLVVDTGGLAGLANNESWCWDVVRDAADRGLLVVIPTIVVTEASVAGSADAVKAIVKRVGTPIPTDATTALLAGELQAKSGTSDPVDSTVVAEALRVNGSEILTSDPVDIQRLVDQQVTVSIKIVSTERPPNRILARAAGRSGAAKRDRHRARHYSILWEVADRAPAGLVPTISVRSRRARADTASP